MQATAIPAITPADARGFLRPIDPRRDLAGIADLVELCFRETLDPDGKSYLKQMRSAARASRLFSWTLDLPDQTPDLPVTGYVWEVDGRVVGNLSIIQFKYQRQRLSLIANVAVHPDYRRMGIGRQLTATALNYLQRHGSQTAWLQVRSDNPGAIHLYESLGFQERTRRTTWYNLPEMPFSAAPNGLQIGPRKALEWPQQRQWLAEVYPDAYSWHLALDWQALDASWRGAVYRVFTLTFPRHWAVHQDGSLLGSVTWLEADGFADSLFLAVPANVSPGVVQALLNQVRRDIPRRKHLTLNCPADLAPEAIQAAGFYAQQTLLWMEIRF